MIRIELSDKTRESQTNILTDIYNCLQENRQVIVSDGIGECIVFILDGNDEYITALHSAIGEIYGGEFTEHEIDRNIEDLSGHITFKACDVTMRVS